MNLKATDTINCPPDQVFAKLIDVELYADWASVPKEISDVSENPARMGTTWRRRASYLGRDLDSSLVVNVFEPGIKYGYAFDKPFPAQLTFTLEPQADSTKLTVTAEFEPGSFFRMAGSVLARSVEDTLEDALQSLKTTLE